jgi:hypothetical protein
VAHADRGTATLRAIEAANLPKRIENRLLATVKSMAGWGTTERVSKGDKYGGYGQTDFLKNSRIRGSQPGAPWVKTQTEVRVGKDGSGTVNSVIVDRVRNPPQGWQPGVQNDTRDFHYSLYRAKDGTLTESMRYGRPNAPSATVGFKVDPVTGARTKMIPKNQ